MNKFKISTYLKIVFYILGTSMLLVACSSVKTYGNSESVTSKGVSLQISELNKDCYIVIKSNFLDVDSWQITSTILDKLENRKCINKYITLNVVGGDINSAMRIGSFIRRHEYNTIVTSELQCTSACTIIYLGGKERYINNNGNISFAVHRIRDKKSGTCYDFTGNQAIGFDSMTTINDAKSYILRMLGDSSGKKFIEYAQSAHCDNLRNLSSSELIASGISTRMITLP